MSDFHDVSRDGRDFQMEKNWWLEGKVNRQGSPHFQGNTSDFHDVNRNRDGSRDGES